MKSEEPQGGMPSENESGDQDNQILRTPEEMRGELRSFIEMHEFPNRMQILRSEKEVLDMDGRPIPVRKRLAYQANRNGVKMRGDTLYGEYMDDDGNIYWVKIGDADYWASRVHGYTGARP